ncbi:MAG: hypothetical protein ACLQDM_14100, partial [Bradyrhizobium sp.]
IARGMPGDWLNLWRLPPAFCFAGGPWVRPAPGIPCALLISEGDVQGHNSGVSRSENAEVCPDVIARSESDEAIQSFLVRYDGLLRFARNDDSE